MLEPSFGNGTAARFVNSLMTTPRKMYVGMRISVIKPITARWMIDLHGYLSSRPSIIVHGFQAAGL